MAHPALSTPDVLHHIFQHLSPIPPFPAQSDFDAIEHTLAKGLEGACELRTTLANASQVCKAFYEPATQMLWASQPEGLLVLLSSTLGYFRKIEYEHSSSSFLGYNYGVVWVCRDSNS